MNSSFNWFTAGFFSACLLTFALAGLINIWPNNKWIKYSVEHQCQAVSPGFSPDRRAFKCDDGFTYYP